MTETKKWRRRVYRPARNDFPDKTMWRKLRKQIIDRDHQTCYRCDVYFPRRKSLSVHHIMPRAEGGGDDPTNLVTLCNPCHDYVEVEGLETRAAIIGSYNANVTEEPGVAWENTTEEPDISDWRRWVYGGDRDARKQFERRRAEK